MPSATNVILVHDYMCHLIACLSLGDVYHGYIFEYLVMNVVGNLIDRHARGSGVALVRLVSTSCNIH